MITLKLSEADKIPTATITSKVKSWNVAPGVVPNTYSYFRVRGGQGYIIGVPSDVAEQLLKEKDEAKVRKILMPRIVAEMQASRNGSPSPGKMLLLMQSGDTIVQVTRAVPGMGKKADATSYIAPALTGAALGAAGKAALNYRAGKKLREGVGKAALTGGLAGSAIHGLNQLSWEGSGDLTSPPPTKPLSKRDKRKLEAILGKDWESVPVPEVFTPSKNAGMPLLAAAARAAAPTILRTAGPMLAGKAVEGAANKLMSPRQEANKVASELSYKARKNLGTGDFALPGRRYPIHDRPHARNALARVAQHGTAGEQSQVQKAVHARFPDIGEKDAAAHTVPEMLRDGALLLSPLAAHVLSQTPGPVNTSLRRFLLEESGHPAERAWSKRRVHLENLHSPAEEVGLAYARKLSPKPKLGSAKTAGMSFLKQDRPEKVKAIFRALKREHPEMPAEMKARIAARQGKPGKQHQGPPYKGPIHDRER